jgi:hypothetical protein
MAQMKYRKRFGRWAEAAVARAFRDRGFEVLTAEGMNRMPQRDMQIRNKKSGFEADVQVKGTARLKPYDCFEYDWGKLRDYVDVGKERNKQWGLAVCNVRKRAIFIFSNETVERYVLDAERGMGDHYSRPGRIHLDYDDASRVWDLTTAEIADGTRIAEDTGESEPDIFSDLPD